MSATIVVTQSPSVVVTPGQAEVTTVVAVVNLPPLGTASALDVGVLPGDVVQVDPAGRVPALDGSLLLNLPTRSPGGGKFSWVSTTQCALKPANGNLLQINGALYPIPAGGVTITNAGLAASTLYYAYAFINNTGAMALEFSTTGHSTAATGSNVGIEVKNGDPTRSLVGMVVTDPGTLFQDTSRNRQVRSWFNDRGTIAFGNDGTNISTGSTVFVELDAAARCTAAVWAGEVFHAEVRGTGTNNTGGQTSTILPWINGASVGQSHFSLGIITTVLSADGGGTVATDALFTVQIAVAVSGGSLLVLEESTKLITIRR
jgi:hypothetical protein